MSTDDRISRYLDAVPEPKQDDMRRLHAAILEWNPGCKLWFLDGKDESGKVVANPGIGYGEFDKRYAGGKKELFQVGISAILDGLSVYSWAWTMEVSAGSVRRLDRQGECHRVLHQVQGALRTSTWTSQGGHPGRF